MVIMMSSSNKTIRKIISRLLLAAVLVITSVPLQKVSAQTPECDTVFYQANDILYYNPCEVCSASNAENLLGDTNEEKIFRWLTAKGFNAAQAAGIMGNIDTESGFNPFRMQTTYSSQGIEAVLPVANHAEYRKAFGLVQWDGGRRQQVLTQTAAKFPDYITDINTYGKSRDGYKDAPAVKNEGYLTFQLEYVYQELENGYTSVFNAMKAEPDSEQGARNVTEIWNRRYEVSGDYTQKRHDQAVEYYKQYKALAGTGVGSAGGECSSGEPAGEVVWYSQCDDRWRNSEFAGNTMCQVGCGPSSMAIILASLVDKNITPTDVAAAAGDQSGGTSSHANLINGVNAKWGTNISAQGIGIDEAIEFVKSGKGYVWMGGSGALPFTAGGHLVAMVGVTSDGQITIADPNGDNTSSMGLHQRVSNFSKAQIAAHVGAMYKVPKK